jgi:hypothetical protein
MMMLDTTQRVKHNEQDLEINPFTDWEPVELSQNWCYAGADPVSGERGSPRRFTLEFTVNFKDFLNNFTVYVKDFSQIRRGRAACPPTPDPRLC